MVILMRARECRYAAPAVSRPARGAPPAPPAVLHATAAASPGARHFAPSTASGGADSRGMDFEPLLCVP